MPTTLPSPFSLGLPARFTDWRPDQIPALDLVLNSPKRFIALAMPTGSGKTVAYMAASHLHEGRAVVLTATKGLQDQIEGEFGEMGVVDVRGQNAYPCKALGKDGELQHLREQGQTQSCEQGPCHGGVKCTLKEAGCEYYDRVRVAIESELVSTNYAFWLAQQRYSKGLGGADLLVLDEAHDAVDELSRILTIKLERWIAKVAGVVPPWELGASPGIAAWASWGAFHQAKILARLENLPTATTPSELKYRRRLMAVSQVLGRIATMRPGNWVEDHTAEAWVFEILDPSAFAEELLFQKTKKVVFSSATLVPKTLALLGVAPDEVDWYHCPSRFPVARRPVWYIPTVRVDYRMSAQDVVLWAARIDQIIDSRLALGRKGIVHTVSYRRAQDLFERSRHKKHMLLNTHASISETVHLFKQATTPAVLVSPSVTTGWDFPGDECRWQIIGKLPMPSTQSAIVKARGMADKDYVPYLMCQTLQQSVGRIVRGEEDWGETAIVDDHWDWARAKYKHHLRPWFREACTQVTTIPTPLMVAA